MPSWKKLIVSGSDASLNSLYTQTAVTASFISASTDITGSNLLVTDTATYNTVEYSNSNTMKFNQVYYGGNNGSYFTNGEYQKVVTITPSAASQNYQVLGRITAQNAGETHTVYFNAALRSQTLPDLDWSIYYDEEYNGARYLDPQLWTKETSTAGFIIAFKTLATIYGNVTVDIDVVPRSSDQKANVTVNSNQNSEQTSVDSGFTAREMEKVIVKKSSDVTIPSGSLAIGTATANSTNGRIDASNDIVAFSSSDERWKENVTLISNPIDKIKQIGGYEFDWKELSEEEKQYQHGNTGHDVGVIAQEIEKVLPEIVTTRDNGFKGVKYDKIVALLIEGIKEQQLQIDELKHQLNEKN